MRVRRERLRAALKALPDIGRALGRLVAGRGSPRDLGQLRDGLDERAALHDRARARARPAGAARRAAAARWAAMARWSTCSRARWSPSPPIDASKGGYIAEGYDAALDALARCRVGDGRRAIAALEARYRDATGIASLKIRHNAVLGYHVEVPAKHADRLMAPDSGFTHRQTLAGVVRFNSPELHEEASRVVEAGAHALAAEAAHLEELTGARRRRRAADRRHRRRARPARRRRRPCRARGRRRLVRGRSSTEQPCFEIEGGRHPVVEAALAGSGERFVANDLLARSRTTGCGWSPARTWAASRPSCARTR